jgi:hypothetical protein
MDDNGLDKVLAAIMIIGSLIPAILFSLLSIKIFSPKKTEKSWMGSWRIIPSSDRSGNLFRNQHGQENLIYKGSKEDIENVAINTTSDTVYVDVKQVNIPQTLKLMMMIFILIKDQYMKKIIFL